MSGFWCFKGTTMPSSTVVKQYSWTSSVSSFKIQGTTYPETHRHITKKWSSLTLFTSRSSNLCHDTLFPENCFYYHSHYSNEALLLVSTAVCPLTKQNVTSHTLCTAVCPQIKQNVTSHTQLHCSLSTNQTECHLPHTMHSSLSTNQTECHLPHTVALQSVH